MKETNKNIIILVINCIIAVANIISNFIGGLSV